jgi:iron complex outermembrane receptor protein
MYSSHAGWLLKKGLCTLIFTATFAAAGAKAQTDSETSIVTDENTIDEIVITARRREEGAQKTPVAVTALNSSAIYNQNITDIDDLTSSVPGVNFTASGGANNTVFSIRGRSRGVFGNALPAVTTYVNEVPLSIWGGNIPTYDMSSLQVLKGPQGTLFGRNSTAGAVLVTTERPSFETGGYGLIKVGEYDARVFEGAVNIPLLDEKLALRIAGQTDDRDGHIENVLHPDSDDYGNHDRENYRISLLFEPTDSLSNVLVYEKNKIHEQSVPAVTVGFDPNPALPGNVVYGAALAQHNALQLQNIRKAYTDIDATLNQELNSVSNTTIWNAGNFSIKNIFGYREVFSHSLSDIDASPFPMINADSITDIEQFSNELQISGKALDGAMEYIGGLFWLKAQPNGGNRLALQRFNPEGTAIDAPSPLGASGPSDFYTDISQAAFGQVSLDLGTFSNSLTAFSVDLGLRHTKDRAENCPVDATHITEPVPTESDCLTKVVNKSEETTYNVGINFQATDDVLLYAVTRTGYRGGGVNSPILVGTLAPFQNYEPETVEDFEIGLKSDWNVGDIAGRFNIAYFDSKYEDVHYAIPTLSIGPTLNTITGSPDLDGENPSNPDNEPTGGLFYSNSGDAKVKGIEVELIVQPTDASKFTFAGSYITKNVDVVFQTPANWSVLPASVLPTKEEIESFIFLGAPRWSYNLGIEHTLPIDKRKGELSLSARYFRMAEVNYGGNVDADEYETVDLRADWLGVSGSAFDAALYVSNVFDRDVILGPSSSTTGLGMNSAIYNDPRMWGALLRYNF